MERRQRRLSSSRNAWAEASASGPSQSTTPAIRPHSPTASVRSSRRHWARTSDPQLSSRPHPRRRCSQRRLWGRRGCGHKATASRGAARMVAQRDPSVVRARTGVLLADDVVSFDLWLAEKTSPQPVPARRSSLPAGDRNSFTRASDSARAPFVDSTPQKTVCGVTGFLRPASRWINRREVAGVVDRMAAAGDPGLAGAGVLSRSVVRAGRRLRRAAVSGCWPSFRTA